jgi:hypothetical protein
MVIIGEKGPQSTIWTHLKGARNGIQSQHVSTINAREWKRDSCLNYKLIKIESTKCYPMFSMQLPCHLHSFNLLPATSSLQHCPFHWLYTIVFPD